MADKTVFSTNKDIGPISHVFDNTVATYKFYWFIAILDNYVIRDKAVMSFWEIIATMIAESWYPIHFFHISFGKSDSIYQQSMLLKDILNLSKDSDKDVISSAILDNINDKQVKSAIRIFTQNVPYRFLSPWIATNDNKEMELRSKSFENNCLYSITGKQITINKRWFSYLKENYLILRDFAYWNLSIFLQRRNPNVPDLSSKLTKPIQRGGLTSQHHLWDSFIREIGGIRCIYTKHQLTGKAYDLDHYIPWSFVSHNQLWNLVPSDPSINCSKSDHLPSSDLYLQAFADIQHDFLRYTFEHKPNEKLLQDYLSIYESIPELINLGRNDFTHVIRSVISPLEQIALNMGFTYWE